MCRNDVVVARRSHRRIKKQAIEQSESKPPRHVRLPLGALVLVLGPSCVGITRYWQEPREFQLYETSDVNDVTNKTTTWQGSVAENFIAAATMSTSFRLSQQCLLEAPT